MSDYFMPPAISPFRCRRLSFCRSDFPSIFSFFLIAFAMLMFRCRQRRRYATPLPSFHALICLFRVTALFHYRGCPFSGAMPLWLIFDPPAAMLLDADFFRRAMVATLRERSAMLWRRDGTRARAMPRVAMRRYALPCALPCGDAIVMSWRALYRDHCLPSAFICGMLYARR